MTRITRTTCLIICAFVLILGFYWNRKIKDLPAHEQVSIFYSAKVPKEDEVKQLSLNFDAIAVSELFLLDQYCKKGVNIPVFFIPSDLDLKPFLSRPLKNQPNPVFTFGHIICSNNLTRYETLIHAFIKAFGQREDVALAIYFPSKKNIFNKKHLRKLIAKLHAGNIVLSDTKTAQKSQEQFLKSLDCYINLSSEEKLLGPACSALALGIPVITDQQDKILSKSSHALRITLEPLYNEQAFIDALQQIYEHYDQHLQHSAQARLWAADYAKSWQNSLNGIRENLTRPKKLIFGKQNCVHQRYVQTNSPQLYQKFALQNPFCDNAISTQLVELLRPLNPPLVPSGIPGIDCVYVINLDERPDRWEAVKKQFDRQHITPYRVSAINGWKIPKQKAIRLFDQDADLLKEAFGGALGCLLSHISVYKNALDQGFETVWICEDDIEFKHSSQKIPLLVTQLNVLDPDWDVLYTDYSSKGEGLLRPRPGQPFYTQIHLPISKELIRIHGRHNTHSMIFSRKGLEKVYAYFTSGHLWSPIDVDIHYTPLLREYSTAEDIVTSIYDSSIAAFDGSSDTQFCSFLNPDQ